MRQTFRFALPALPALVLVALPLVPACELFGQVACEEDSDCPDSLPFCVEDFCAADPDEDDEGRGIDGEGEGEPGEGEGEGEASGCSAAAEASQCPDGLCDEDGQFGSPGTCLPPDDIDDCSNESVVGAPPRDAAGPVIFALTYESIGDGCFTNVTFSFFDRQDDVSPTSPFVELVVSGSFQTQSTPPSTDGKTFSFGDAFICGAGPDVAGLLLMDGASNKSNTLCLRPPG